MLGAMSDQWTTERVGDFNGDGRADVLWRHTSGVLAIWFIDGTRVIATGSPGDVDTDWHFQ